MLNLRQVSKIHHLIVNFGRDIYIYIFMYVCMDVCIYIYIYIYVYRSLPIIQPDIDIMPHHAPQVCLSRRVKGSESLENELNLSLFENKHGK